MEVLNAEVGPWGGLGGMVPLLRRYLAVRLRDANEIDDVVQETLLRAARYRPTLQSESRLTAWILQIATNVMRDALRKSCRFSGTAEDDAELDELEGGELPPSSGGHDDVFLVDGDVLDREIMLRYLARAYRRLPRSDKDVLKSFYRGSGSCREVGEACSISPELAKVRLFRARRRLERWMRQLVADDRSRRLEWAS